MPTIDWFNDLDADADLLPHRVDIAKTNPLSVSPNFASQSGTEANPLVKIAYDVPCLVDEKVGQDGFKFNRRSVDATHIVYFSGTLDLMIDYVIIYNQRRLRVKDAVNELSTGKVTTAYCQEISE